MRGAIGLVLLLLAPLSSGVLSPLTISPDLNTSQNAEFVLLRGTDVWTSEDWNALLEQSIQPLRVLSPNQLLVWSNEERIAEQSWSAEPAEHATLRAPEGWKGGSGAYRILLEPRLPAPAIHDIMLSLEQLGLTLNHAALDVSGNVPASLTVETALPTLPEQALRIPGLLWVEPVLQTHARNGQASSLIEHGALSGHPFWDVGLNGAGVVVGVADSGIDADHACFRNATTPSAQHAEEGATHPAVGVFGPDHRKIRLLNTSIDGNDTPGHSDYRHGTHVIGSLACHDVYSERAGLQPTNGSSLAHGATLVVQDIVSQDGWTPPPVDELLWEASAQGALIHSNSWGDDTTAYTERTGRFDAYARAMPWSAAFIAPGNGGQGVLEPANGRNVIAISATGKSVDVERWGGTAYGPTDIGTDGIFMLAPGASIQSAAADGFWDTNNDNLRPSSGTSMATPHAAGGAAIVQQLYQDGWLMPAHAPTVPVSLNDLAPRWNEASSNMTVLLGEGFTPSGPLLRASLAMAASPLSEDLRNGGEGGMELHNPYDGWGVFNLSQLVDPLSMANNTSPSADVWIHDSYRLTSSSVGGWFEANRGEANNLTGLGQGWTGEGATGPFLQTGEVFTQRLTPIDGESVRIRMAFPAQPEPAIVDDLQLRVRLEDGTVLLADQLQADGAPTSYYPEAVDTNDTAAFPATNETTLGINLPWALLNGSSFIDVDVVARYVQPGGESGTVGLDGDAVGFALVVKGVDRDSSDHRDDDGDGVVNVEDACPNENSSAEDEDGDGCLDDADGDGVLDSMDACPDTNASEADNDGDGCPDDTDGDGITDDVDRCDTPDNSWPVTGEGCYPLDQPLSVAITASPDNGSRLDGDFIVAWEVGDADGDGHEVFIEIIAETAPSIVLLTCTKSAPAPGPGACSWTFPDDLPPFYRTEERYRVHMAVSSTNASPAGDRTPSEFRLAEGLSMRSNEVIAPPEEKASNVASAVVWLGLLGVLAGVWATRWMRQRIRPGDGSEASPPFSSTANEHGDSLQNLNLNGER
ncbi:MAG: S8 family serine peptidase [Poseidonia sp.]